MIMEEREGNGHFLRWEEHMGPCMEKKNTPESSVIRPVLEEFYDLNHQGKVFFLVVYPLV